MNGARSRVTTTMASVPATVREWSVIVGVKDDASAIGVERGGHPYAESRERRLDPGVALRRGQEHHEPAAPGAEQLTAKGACPTSDVVQVVDLRARHAGGQ